MRPYAPGRGATPGAATASLTEVPHPPTTNRTEAA